MEVYLRASVITVFLSDLPDFLLDLCKHLFLVLEKTLVEGNLDLKLVEFVDYLLRLHVAESAEPHLDDGVGLLVGQCKSGLQVYRSLCVVRGLLDDFDYFIDVLKTYLQTKQDVFTLLSLCKVKTCPACCNFFAVLKIVVEHLLEVQALRATFDKGQVVHVEVGLQVCIQEQMIDGDLGNSILLELDDDSDSVTSGLVPDCGNVLQDIILAQVVDLLDQCGLVYLIGDFREHDALVRLVVLYVVHAAQDDLSLSGLESIPDSFCSADFAVGREVGAFHVLHELQNRDVRVLDQRAEGVRDLAEVVGRHVVCHTDRDSAGSVGKKEGEACRKNLGLLEGFIEVGYEIDRILVDILEHELAHACHLGFSVSVCCGWVTVNRSEVSLRLDNRIAHGEVLGQSDQGIVDRCISVRVELTEDVSDRSGALLE